MRKWAAVLGIVFLACSTAELKTAERMVREQKFYNAIEYYLSFVRAHPEHSRAPEAMFEAGKIQQVMLSEHEKAMQTYRKLVSRYPIGKHTVAAQERIADIQKSHFGDCQAAIIEYEKLIHAAPEHERAPKHQFEIAHCYTQLHNYEQASIEFRLLAKKYPNYEKLDEVYYQLGNNAYISGKYEEAVEAYQMIRKEFPKSSIVVQALFGIGNAYEEMNRFDLAKQYYETIKDKYPSPGVVEIRLKGLQKRKKERTDLAPGAKLR